MRLPRLLLSMLAIALCASRARAAEPHPVDPDAPKSATPRHTATASRRVAPALAAAPSATAPATPSATPSAPAKPEPPRTPTRTPSRSVRPAPSISLQLTPPPGMGILTRLPRNLRSAPRPQRGDSGSSHSNEDRWIL